MGRRTAVFCVAVSAGADPALRRLFADVDRDRDGALSVAELEGFYANHGLFHVGDGIDNAAARAGGLEYVAKAWDVDESGFATLGDLLSKTESLSEPSRDAPQQQMLALTGDSSEMRVTWVTRAAARRPRVEWRQVGESDWSTARATSSTYDVPVKWWEPDAWRGWIHSAIMTDLEPARDYSYVVRSDAASSNETTFPSTREPGSRVDIACYGDMGTVMPLGFQVATQLRASHARRPFDAVFHFGDLSYAGMDTAIPFLGIAKDDEWEYLWDLFGRQTRRARAEFENIRPAADTLDALNAGL